MLLGLDAPDDAAVYRISDDLALVQSVDFFTPIVDSAYDWGAIAVANAVSDIYAMGGRPVLGLNLVGWPKELDLELLAELIAGAADKASEAGMSVVGGHTIDDPEPKFGMAVTGFVHPDKIVTSSDAGPGMHLILTKPLGTGIVSTAIKNEKADASTIATATALMSALNADAAAAMTEVGATAATDVTGFGFIGHLHNFLRLSGVSARIDASQVPVLEGVFDLAEAGMVPGGTRRNEDHYGQWVDFDDEVEPLMRTVLFDAQTSGGLLIAVEEDKVAQLSDLLDTDGLVWADVGVTTDEPGSRVRVSG